MPEALDPYHYLGYLRNRWKLIAVAAAVAGTLALVVSLLLTEKYTAAARIFIEPPAGSDVRASVAVSPIYLESLRTYEHFASSDSLFQQALDEFQLRSEAPDRSIESWKRSVLDVSIPHNTKILEIRVTLPNPQRAKDLATYLAERTVALNRSVSRDGDLELVTDAEKQIEESRTTREEVEAEWGELLAGESITQLSAEIDAADMQRYRLQRSLIDAELRAAEGDPADARVEYLRRELAGVEKELTSKRSLLAKRTARHDRLTVERQTAQASYEAAQTRLREVRSSVGYRGERLKIIDPGIVPERPSSPNIPLNVMAALLFALVASLLFLTLRYSFDSGAGGARPEVVHLRAKARNG